MKEKFIKLYMDWAHRAAELSHARRLHVGAVIVKDDTVISYGYNGMPAGWDNNCEYKDYDLSKDFNGNYFPDSEKEYPLEDEHGRYRLKTKSEVLHAEMNSLMKLAKSSNSGNHASMFITHSPCLECAKGIYQAGIKEVFYGEDYRLENGIYFLKKCGVKIEKAYGTTLT
jgi:dCMP deaminase